MQLMEKSMDVSCQLTWCGAQAVMEQDPEEEKEDGRERALVVATLMSTRASTPPKLRTWVLSLPDLFKFQTSLKLNSKNHFWLYKEPDLIPFVWGMYRKRKNYCK